MRTDIIENMYCQYYQPLLLYALSLTHHLPDAQDLVANAFVKAILSFEKGNIKAWLYTVLRNEFYNEYNKKRRLVHDYHMEQIKDDYDFVEQMINEERKQWLYKQIYQLPFPEREIILLSLQAKLDDSDIAKMMNISIENVRVIRYRTKKKLMDQCEKEGYL